MIIVTYWPCWRKICCFFFCLSQGSIIYYVTLKVVFSLVQTTLMWVAHCKKEIKRLVGKDNCKNTRNGYGEGYVGYFLRIFTHRGMCYLVSGKLPRRRFPPRKVPPMKISPYESPPLWKLPPRNLPPRKLPPGKITPNEIPSPVINHTNERKNKIIELFVLKKAVQYNILIKITKVLFDTQTISQKILGLDTFFTEWKKSKYRTKVKIAKWHLLVERYAIMYLANYMITNTLSDKNQK